MGRPDVKTKQERMDLAAVLWALPDVWVELCYRIEDFCSGYGDKLTQAAVKALEYVCSSYFLYTVCPFPLDMRRSHFQLRMHEWVQGQKDKRIVQSLIPLIFITLVIYQETDCCSASLAFAFFFSLQHICKCYLLIVTSSFGLSTLILYHKLWPAAFCCCCFLY